MPSPVGFAWIKSATKAIARDLKIAVPEALTFDGAQAPLADEVIAQLGTSLVIKPADQGSSVGLHFAEHRSRAWRCTF